jgi:hypothetical protein
MKRIDKSALFILVIAMSLGVGCNAQLVVGDGDGTSVVCTNDRLVKLVLDGGDNTGMYEAIADPAGGYYLYRPVQLNNPKVTRVDASGNKGETLPISSELGPWVTDVAPTPDGGALISGTVGSFEFNSWVGRVDANWQLAWETTLDVSTDEIALLPDGGAVVAGSYGESEAGPTGISLARLDPSGNVVWQETLPLEGFIPEWLWYAKRLSVRPDGFRMLASTEEGIQLIDSTLDGELTQWPIDSTLALTLTDSATLPDGRLAIASTRSSGAVLTVVASNGAVLWEKLFGQGTSAEGFAVAYNAGRNELLLGGSYRGTDGGTMRTWMVAADMDGNQTWEMVRTPIDFNIDGYATATGDGQGPPITDIAVQPDGSFIATGETSNLSYFAVSADDCDAASR